jgi:putative ABC transport system permease protein
LPLPLAPGPYPGQLGLALAYGVLTTATFALWPLGRAHDLPVSALFRDEVAPERRVPRPRYVAATILAAAALAAFAVAAAYDRRIAIVFIVSALAVFGSLRLVAMAVMAIARRVGRPRSAVLRLAVANIYRPGALTPTVVISLGLGLAVLVTVIEIDANLRQELATVLPEKAPSFYFLDIPARDAARFDAFVHANAPRADLERVPMLRGRIVAARSVKAEDLTPKPDAAWALQSDRGLTYTGVLPTGSRLTDGEWWGKDYSGPPLVSFEKKVAEGLGLAIGDEVVVNVLGRNMTARIANLRTVDWQSLGINFVMVFSPGAFAGAPVTDIATVTFPGGGSTSEETTLMAAVTDAFPGVTAVRVKDALDAFQAIVSNLVLGVRSASAVTLAAAVLVLAGALAAGHRHRVYDAVILKTLGATRRQLLTAYAVEYLLIGSATVAFGVAAGSLAGWGVVVHFMSLPYHWQGAPALAAAAAAVLLTVFLGLAGTWPALSHKPAPVLRNL